MQKNYSTGDNMEKDKSSLSTVHISPHTSTSKFWLFGNKVYARRFSEGKTVVRTKSNKRQVIKKFTWRSRRRLMSRLCETNKKVQPLFVTLTYPEVFPEDSAVWKKHIDSFWKSFIRAFPKAGCVWKLEPQKRGAPHFHLLVWGVDQFLATYCVPFIWYRVVGSGDKRHLLWHQGRCKDKNGNYNKPCVEKIRSRQGVFDYASKYLGKSTEESDAVGWFMPGRFWGFRNAENIDWSPVVECHLDNKEVAKLIRLFVRFGRFKHHNYQALSCLCDAEFWFDRLDRIVKY